MVYDSVQNTYDILMTRLFWNWWEVLSLSIGFKRFALFFKFNLLPVNWFAQNNYHSTPFLDYKHRHPNANG